MTEYAFYFPDLVDSAKPIRIIKNGLSYAREVLVEVNDTRFSNQLFCQVPSLYADLIDLAVSVHIADRFAIGKMDRPRRLEIYLPLRHPELFDDPLFRKKLQETLFWYTGDQWNFVFSPRQSIGRMSEIQGLLDLRHLQRPVDEVALWSSGLDSFAGLIGRMESTACQRYVLFGSGSNSQIHARQRELADMLLPTGGQEVACTQVIYRYSATNTPRNSNQRT